MIAIADLQDSDIGKLAVYWMKGMWIARQVKIVRWDDIFIYVNFAEVNGLKNTGVFSSEVLPVYPNWLRWKI